VHPDTHPALLEAGITGADLNQPLFDGTSTNPHDHLIDIDTPSMETCPDVRVYFYLIGEVFDEIAGIERPKDHEGRIIYDARVVRAGREYLKYCRSLGAGPVLFFFQIEQDGAERSDTGYPLTTKYSPKTCRATTITACPLSVSSMINSIMAKTRWRATDSTLMERISYNSKVTTANLKMPSWSRLVRYW
jgi:hypothetical protein